LLLLSLLWGCTGQPADKLVVMPREPVVQYGGSAQLNCSLACAAGTVQWKGLDINLGSITSFPTYSILHISSAVVAMGGTKICQGTCHGRRYQHAVNLKVYALPDTLQLEADPLEPGQPASLRCSAQRVYPLTGLVLTWYRGGQALEEADFDVTETDEELFDIVSTLLVAGEEVGEGVEFRCEVTLSVGQEALTRVASVAVSTGAVMEQPVAMATSTGSPWTGVTTTGTPSTAGPVTTAVLPPEPSVPTRDPTTALTATPREPDAKTILEPAAATEPPSTERPAPQDLVAGRPSEGTLPACTLRIWSLPPNGTRGRALRIECCARCAGNATVRWLRTPVALSQYREEVVGSSSTLRLDHAEPRHQGHYQCVLLGHRSQMVSLQLTVSDGSFSTGPAITVGTTVSLLGLIVTGVTSHRLWKRLRFRYEL
ncbi:MADCA protein, partial [Sagittarius serpentarius]|nr:MADCA protein [Sagittarius serpentarius]